MRIIVHNWEIFAIVRAKIMMNRSQLEIFSIKPIMNNCKVDFEHFQVLKNALAMWENLNIKKNRKQDMTCE